MSVNHLLLAEVAERLRTSVRQVKAWLRSGELRGIDVSSKRGSLRPRYVIDQADLEEFEKRRATSPPLENRRPRQRLAAVPNYFA